MTGHDPIRGLRPIVSAPCRASLQAHLEGLRPASPVHPEASQAADHVAGCEDCRHRVLAAEVLASALRRRPGSPDRLSSPAFLELIYERAIAQYEDGGSVVSELARPAAPPLEADALSGPRGLLASSVGALVGAAPPQPSVWAWEKVRRSVRAETLRPALRAPRWRLLLAATVAAALAIGVLLVLDRPNDRQREIRFVDLGTAPAVEFAVLRHGLAH